MEILRIAFKYFLGVFVIVALSVMLKAFDPDTDTWWLMATQSCWTGYCYMEYLIRDNKK